MCMDVCIYVRTYVRMCVSRYWYLCTTGTTTHVLVHVQCLHACGMYACGLVHTYVSV